MASRRDFLTAAAAAAAMPIARVRGQRAEDAAGTRLPASISALSPMTAGARPITVVERRTRIEKARRLMAEQRLDAIMLTAGTSLNYFTGIRWGLSERLFAVIV